MRFLAAVACCSFILAACGGGGGGNTSDGSAVTTPTLSATYSLTGQAQKGPLIFGSRIWVSELDSNLNPNGKIYLAQTKDDLGNFVISSTIGTNLVELVGTGYYMDELTGSLSTSPVTLSAIADLSVDNTPTINILTTLQAPRMKALIMQGNTYAQASARSQTEVLAAFGVNSSKITSLNALYAMQINGTSDQDSALLAASAILSKMATTAATANGSSQAAEMTYLLSRIASDIQNGGSLTTSSIITARNSAAVQLDLTAIRTNVETYYANRGLTMTAPKFEEWIDKDGSGILPRRLAQAIGLTFSNTTGVEHSQQVTSNAITVGGMGTGVAASVSANAGTTIIKNGSAISSLFTTATDGDTIAVRRTSLSFGQTDTASVSVGSTTAKWQVTTRTPSIVYASGWSVNCSGGAQTIAKYYAHPFIATVTGPVRYLAIGTSDASSMFGNTPTKITSVSVFSNESTNNVPSSALASSNNFASYFDVALADVNGVSHPAITLSNSGYTSAYFGSSGVALTQGTKYWVVVAYPSSSANDRNLCFGSGVVVDFANRLASNDGATWTNWDGGSSMVYANVAMPLYMAN